MHRASKRARGFALMLAIFFLILTTFLSHAYLSLVPSELRAAYRHKSDAQASLTCEAGIQDTIVWLRDSDEADSLAVGTPVTRSYTMADGWQWEVVVDPQGSNVYLLTATAVPPGRTSDVRRVQTMVEAGGSYSKWLLLTDTVTASVGAWAGRFDGPVHYNAALTVSVSSSLYSGGGPPVFGGGLSTSGAHSTPDGINYSGPAPYDASGNPIPGRYEALYGDRSMLQTGVQRVDLPTDTAPQRDEAWQTGPPPTAPGVWLDADPTGQLAGGIYIVGDVSSMQLGLDPSGNSQMIIAQASGTTTIVEVTDAPITSPGGVSVAVGSTLAVAADGTETIYPNHPNGVVYGTGDIDGLQGVNRGARTIAVDMAANKSITLSGSLTRADTPVGSIPIGDRDRLGIVAQDVHVAGGIASPERDDLHFYASILAGRDGTSGSFRPPWTESPQGNLTIVGSLTQAQNSSWYSSGSGYIGNFRFDPVMASNPPPGYPGGVATVSVRSWREESTVE